MKFGHYGTEYWPVDVILGPVVNHIECLRRVSSRLDPPGTTPHDMIVSCLDHFIHEVRAVFLAGASYYSPVRLAPGFLRTKLSKIQLTLGKETRALIDMPRPLTACFFNSLPHYNGLTKRETTAANCARDRDPNKKEVEWDLDIEGKIFDRI